MTRLTVRLEADSKQELEKQIKEYLLLFPQRKYDTLFHTEYYENITQKWKVLGERNRA